MRALMVTKWVPLPDNDGGKQRSLAVARRLAQCADVVLCTYLDRDAEVSGLEDLGIDVRAVTLQPGLAQVARGALQTRSVSSGRFYREALRDAVRAAAHEAPLDILQVEYLQMDGVTHGIAARRRVLDLHNVESALVASYAGSQRGAKRGLVRLEAAALRALERKVVPTYDTVVVVSEEERRRLDSGGPVLVCPNGRDLSAEPLPPATTPTVAFVATLGWPPNVDAALWFGRAVWPEVVRKVPEARLLLVGRDPTPEVQALASPSVEVSGTVVDVRPYLARARVAVAPLRSGGGTRLKVLEALDAGRPLVATSVAIDGFESLIGRGVVLADEAPAMADALARLLLDPAAATQLGHQGHRAVADGHSWEAALAPMVEAWTT